MRFVLIFLFMVQFVLSQEQQVVKGSVTGVVINGQTQEPLPGANVIIAGTTKGASTDENGLFTIQNVEIGIYNLRISLIGFNQTVITDIVVNGVRPATVKINLQETKVEFEGVDVVAEYFVNSPETPISTRQQSVEEIRRLPGGQEDVVRAISVLPGVAQVQAGRNDLIVRGGAPSENLFIIDNIEVPNINHFGTQGASGGPLSYINLDFVEATTFSTGGFGVRYGDKLSSLLKINFREGRNDRISAKATLAATQVGANLEGPIGEQGSFLFSVRRSYLDFLFKAAGFGFVPEYWDAMMKGSYRLSQNDQLSYVGIAALDRVKFFYDTPEQRFDNSRILGSDQDQIVQGITWKHLFSSGFTTVSFSSRYNSYDFRQKDSLLHTIFSSATEEWETSLQSETVLKLSQASEFSFGAQAKLNSIETTIALPQFTTSFGDSVSTIASQGITSWKRALFAQWLQSLGHLQVSFGARADYCSLIEKPWAIAPRFSGSYALNSRSTINGSIGRYYQSPAAVWLVSNPTNTSLKHIQVDQYIVGVDHLLQSDIKLSIEVYKKEYKQYPVSLQRPYLVMSNTGAGFGGSEEGFASFGVDRLASLGSGEAHGVELFLQKKMSEIPMYGTVSISFNETEFTALDGIVRPGSFDQKWILNVGAGYMPDNTWELSAKFRFASGKPYTPFNPDGTQSAVLYNTGRLAANHSLDLRVDRRWAFEQWALITYIDIQNVYNKKPNDVPRYNQQSGKVEESDSIGILPSIGVSAEF